MPTPRSNGGDGKVGLVMISRGVAGLGESLTPNAIEVYVSRLRAKLRPAGIRIRTVRGVGYSLEKFDALR